MGKIAARPLQPVADPLRVVLADAITGLREARDRSLSAHAAAKRAEENLQAARQAFDQANEAVAAARDHHARVLIRAARDDAEVPSGDALRAARDAAVIAADNLEAATSAFNELTEACRPVDAAVKHAEREVNEAVDALIAERAPDTLAEAEALAKSLSTKILELQFLRDVLERVTAAKRLRIISSHDDTPSALAALNATPDEVIPKRVERFLLEHSKCEEWRDSPFLEDWRRASEALKLDADVSLP